MRICNIFRRVIILLIFFSLLTAVFTFPLIFKINSSIPAFHSTDESYAALWNFWWLKYAHLNKLSDSSCRLIAAPFGIDLLGSWYPLWNFTNKWLSILTNNIFTYNIEVLFSFLTAAIFMYYLAYYLINHRIAGIISSLIYAFSPYHFVRAWQHLGLAQIQWMPLYLLMLIKLKEKPDFKHVFLAVLSLFLVFSFDFYYAYFMFIVTLSFILFMFISQWRLKLKSPSYLQNDWKVFKMIFFVGILTFILASPSLYIIFKGRKNYALKEASAHNTYLRPFEDLFGQSAKPLSYFLPATMHPIFGKFTEQFIGSPLYGVSFTEHTLYLGWVPLVLAFIAFRGWRKIRKQIDNLGTHPQGDSPCNRENFYIGFFVFLAILAWLFSQPPWWGFNSLKIYMPSFFMYKILPMFRAYCRFGILVMLAVSVLAGFGLKFILDKFKTQKTKIALTCLFSILVSFEFWNYPPFKVIDALNVPSIYYWIKEQPGDFLIAEYPLDADSANELYKFYQTKHEKKIINGTISGSYANMLTRTITKLSELKTTSILKWMGVKYAVVHRQAYLDTGLIEWIEELNKISQNPGLKFLKSFSNNNIAVYEVAANPEEPQVQ